MECLAINIFVWIFYNSQFKKYNCNSMMFLLVLHFHAVIQQEIGLKIFIFLRVLWGFSGGILMCCWNQNFVYRPVEIGGGGSCSESFNVPSSPHPPPSYFFIKFNVSQNGKNSDKILNMVKTCKLVKTSQSLLLFVTLRLIPACNTSGTILESYFEQRSPTRKSEQPMQLGCGESCEPPGRDRIHNPGRVH